MYLYVHVAKLAMWLELAVFVASYVHRSCLVFLHHFTGTACCICILQKQEFPFFVGLV